MKLKSLLSLLLSSCLFSASYATEIWEYKDWETAIVGDNFVRYMTHGQAVWGHEFGFIRSVGQCDAPESLWLTFSTYEDDLSGLEGATLSASFTVDGQAFEMNLPVLGVQKFTPTMSIAFFTNIAVSDELRRALMNGNEVSVEFVAPQNLVAKFDIPQDTFSLAGITANSTKAMDVCQTGPATLAIAPRVSNEEMQRAALQQIVARQRIPNTPNNLISDASQCRDPLEYGFVANIVGKMEFNSPVALFGNYLASAEGSDGGSPYPPISISNVCDPKNELKVVDIPGTEQQVFQLIEQDGYVYALSNNRSVGGLYELERSDVLFQVIDVRDLNNAVVVGSLELDGLVPEMALLGSQVFITESDWLKVIDVSNPAEPALVKEHKVDRGQFGTQGIATTDADLLITSDRKVQAINPQTGQVQWTLTLADRPSDIFVEGQYAYVRTKNRAVPGSSILKLTGLKDNPSVIKTMRFADPLYYLYQHDRFLLDGEGTFAIELGDDDTLITPNRQN